jgi:hypothetical protein
MAGWAGTTDIALARIRGADDQEQPRETHMDNTTLLIILVILVILLGGGWYGRGRWY